jgi:hypothetical protein
MQDDFTARIAQSFGDWGFAVLNKGNSGGVIANADLQVKRGETVVAKLKVRNVEQNISVVDIVPDSIAEGVLPQSGDVVVVAPREKKDEKAPITDAVPPPPPGPATPAPAVDPFATPAPAPAAMDPFGGAAPAAPAAPAPAAADPFGAAPAAPAAGAGTQASPSTADPFAKP